MIEFSPYSQNKINQDLSKANTYYSIWWSCKFTMERLRAHRKNWLWSVLLTVLKKSSRIISANRKILHADRHSANIHCCHMNIIHSIISSLNLRVRVCVRFFSFDLYSRTFGRGRFTTIQSSLLRKLTDRISTMEYAHKKWYFYLFTLKAMCEKYTQINLCSIYHWLLDIDKLFAKDRMIS